MNALYVTPYRWFLFGILVAAALLPRNAWPLDSLGSGVALKGVSAIAVVIADLPQTATDAGLWRDRLQTDAELRLRRAGIVVSPRAEFTFLVTVLMVRARAGQILMGYAYAIQAEGLETVILFRDANKSLSNHYAATWSAPLQIGIQSKDDIVTNVRQDVADIVDGFINDYLAQNPKR
jgi:hypothetical protein